MIKFLKQYQKDIIFLLIITVACSLIASIYLSGERIKTGYPDWMYHAYRALSMQQYGLLSWDNIWDNGIDYWRGYQLFAAAVTAAVSSLASISITKAMLLLTFACYIGAHIASYIAARSFGIRPAVSLGVVGVLLAMTHIWIVVGFYSTMFAAVAFPLMLALWRISSSRPRFRPVFAFSVGLSVYIHPLLMLAAGGLWVISVILDRSPKKMLHTLVECLTILSVSFFYWYTLVFISFASSDPYQLSNDFLYIVAVVFHYPVVFYVIACLVLAAAVLKPAALSGYSQYLFWYVALVFAVCFASINSDFFSWLNRFQLYRLGFFITPVIIILFGELIQKLSFKSWRPIAYMTSLVFVAGCAQALIYTSVYGGTIVNEVKDPVSQFFDMKEAPTGSIFIADATTPSYNNPSLRFNNGYNNQLLPQQVNLRLLKLLGETAPNYSVDMRDIATVESYLRLLGVQYVFLSSNSPYIQPLIDRLGLINAGTVKDTEYDQTVLMVPWKATNAVAVDCGSIDGITKPTYPGVLSGDDYTQLDAAVIDAADIIYDDGRSTFIATEFPTKDSIRVIASDDDDRRCILLNQSHASNWLVKGGQLQATNYGMMLIKQDANNESVIELRHTWGSALLVQALLLIVASGLTVYGALKLGRGGQDA